MEDGSFDAVSRRVARGTAGRRPLLALGAAGLMAALVGPFAAEGKSKNNKKGNKKKKARNQQRECPPAADLCATQVQPCVDALTESCGDSPCPDQIACCSELAACDFGGFLSCVFAAAGN